MTLAFMGVAEIAKRLDVPPARARTISRRKSFPESTRLTLGRVCSAEDVEAWIREHWERRLRSSRHT